MATPPPRKRHKPNGVEEPITLIEDDMKTYLLALNDEDRSVVLYRVSPVNIGRGLYYSNDHEAVMWIMTMNPTWKAVVTPPTDEERKAVQEPVIDNDIQEFLWTLKTHELAELYEALCPCPKFLREPYVGNDGLRHEDITWFDSLDMFGKWIDALRWLCQDLRTVVATLGRVRERRREGLLYLREMMNRCRVEATIWRDQKALDRIRVILTEEPVPIMRDAVVEWSARLEGDSYSGELVRSTDTTQRYKGSFARETGLSDFTILLRVSDARGHLTSAYFDYENRCAVLPWTLTIPLERIAIAQIVLELTNHPPELVAIIVDYVKKWKEF